MRRGRVALAFLGLVGLAAVAGAPRARVYWREWALRSVPRPLDVLVVTLDTTRADRLGCYRVHATETPNLDRVAARGVLFERAYAHAPLTAPSHSSLMSGLIPARHGVHHNGSFVLPDDVPTLAEQFVRAGYRTGAFVSAFVLDRRFGLARGFATYEDDVLGGGRDRVDAEVRADVTVDRALSWLQRDDARPFFAWVHFYDPHAFYEPPEPFATRYRSRPYDGEIASMDSQIGRLLDAVSARGRPTLIAVVGDHGESLGEHNEPTHSYYIYEATQRVPFLLSLPGHLPQGLRVDPLVRGVDLMPTLLELSGLPVPVDLDGRSLIPLLTGRSSASPGPAYIESYEPRLAWGAQELVGLRDGRWLYVRSPRPELYDVDADPGALRNLAASRSQDLVSLDGRLTKLLERARPLGAGGAVDTETADRLRALGYSAGGTLDPADGPLPDAKDNEPLLRGVTEGRDLIARQQVAEGLEVLRATLRIEPRSTAVREQLAVSLLGAGNAEEAAALFASLSAELPGEERYWVGQIVAERRRGRPAEVFRIVQEALAHLPRSGRVHEEQGRELLAARRVDEAIAALQEAVRLSPRQAAPRLRLGAALLASHRDVEGASALRAVVALSPRSHEAREAAPLLTGIGNRLLEEGQFEEASQAYRAALDGGEQGQDVYLNLGLARHRAGHVSEALEAVVAGVQKWPESAALQYRSARLLGEAGRAAEAEAAYRKTLQLEPSRLDAQVGLAALLDAQGRRGEAADLWRRVAAEAGDRPEGRRARLALEGRD